MLLQFCPHAVFPFSARPIPLRAFPKWPPDDDEAESDLHFSRFLAFKPVSREAFRQNAVERSRRGVFLHFKCVSRKTFSKNSPRKHAFRCLETVSCKKLSKANCHRPFAMTFTFYVSRETYGIEHPIKKKKSAGERRLTLKESFF